MGLSSCLEFVPWSVTVTKNECKEFAYMRRMEGKNLDRLGIAGKSGSWD